MSTFIAQVVDSTGHVHPVVVNPDPDARPDTTTSHLLGWCHLSTECQHPACVAITKGTPLPNGEELAAWYGQHPDLWFMVGWFDRVYGHRSDTSRNIHYSAGFDLAAAYMAVTR